MAKRTRFSEYVRNADSVAGQEVIGQPCSRWLPAICRHLGDRAEINFAVAIPARVPVGSVDS